MLYIGFYSNKEMMYLFQTGFPNGLFTVVGRHRVITYAFVFWGV